MDSIQGLLISIGWFLFRFGIPVGITLLICRLFRRIDSKWQEEGQAYLKHARDEGLVPIVRCWILNDCPEEKRENCPAYKEQGIPCWQQFRSLNGELKEQCIGCGVFRGAPVPAIGD